MHDESHIFYVPHPDDETLNMSVGIRNALHAGHAVYLILLTDGAADHSLDILSGRKRCPWHDCVHDPAAEGFKDEAINIESYTAARQREFLEAAERLGVPRENITIHTYPDGALLAGKVRDIAEKVENNPAIPGTKHHHSMSGIFDDDRDHIAAGKALLDLYREGRITPPVFYVKYSIWKYIKDVDAPVKVIEPDGTDTELLREICFSIYRRYDPAEGYYAIGFHSTPGSFNRFIRQPANRIHHVFLPRRR